MIVPKTRRRPPAPRPSAANRVAATLRWGRRASRGLRYILGSVARKSWGLAQIQATSFAVASAADAASRVLEVDDSPSAMDKARVAMGLSLSDQGVEADPDRSLSVTCDHGCARGQAAIVKVAVGVDLPGFASLGIGRDVVVVDAERAITLPGEEEQ